MTWPEFLRHLRVRRYEHGRLMRETCSVRIAGHAATGTSAAWTRLEAPWLDVNDGTHFMGWLSWN